MSVKIVLTDSNDRPKVNHEVLVQWKGGGTSKGRTNNNGEYDTGVNGGTISRISSYGSTIMEYDLRCDRNETKRFEV